MSNINQAIEDARESVSGYRDHDLALVNAGTVRALIAALEPSEDNIERAARAICDASGETWHVGMNPVLSGPNFEFENHPLDPVNNHWRHKARAVYQSIGERG